MFDYEIYRSQIILSKDIYFVKALFMQIVTKMRKTKIVKRNRNQNSIKTFKNIKKWLSDENGIVGAILQDPRDNSEEEISCTGAFIAIGHKPNTEIFNGQLDMDNGYIIIKSGLHGSVTSSSVEGVFAAGDVSDQIYRQA